MRVFIVVPPWVESRGDREAFVRSAATVAGRDRELLDFSGRATAHALAGRLASRVDASSRSLVLLPAGTEGEQAAAILAAELGGVTLGRCTHVAVEGDRVIARRAIFGGRAGIALHSDAAVTCATVRADAAAAAHAMQLPTQAIAIDETDPLPAEAVPSTARFPRVEGAGLVVSGGRGIGAPDGFDLLARVATALGAGLGGSLPAVDAGWVPVGHQVGQSGKFVSPRLYFAVAISGTPQHLAGIAPTARLVALNSDRDAPIFSRCDVGVEGDWREILPLLAAELERLRPAA